MMQTISIESFLATQQKGYKNEKNITCFGIERFFGGDLG